jgi:hypothetical protein
MRKLCFAVTFYKKASWKSFAITGRQKFEIKGERKASKIVTEQERSFKKRKKCFLSLNMKSRKKPSYCSSCQKDNDLVTAAAMHWKRL